MKKTITHFSHSGDDAIKLEALRKKDGINRGLESIGNTRFANIAWSAISVQRCQGCIRKLVTSREIDLGVSFL